MQNKSHDLHGMAPDNSSVALLLIDVINDLEFEGADRLMRYVMPMAERLAELKRRARAANIPVLYVNDNYGKWQSNFTKLIDRCLQEDVRGKEMVEALRPDEDDYFVLKPKHSGFFSTTLEVLLEYLNVRTVILTGLAGNICILFTANDAYMRDLRLIVPSDCCASNEASDNEYALEQMRTILKADIRPSTELDLKQIIAEADQLCARGVVVPAAGARPT
ncbi:MAG: isochorismatase family cysteine hydrolase [Byssovorax sp.]